MTIYDSTKKLQEIMSVMPATNVNSNVFLLFEKLFNQLNKDDQERIRHDTALLSSVCPDYFTAFDNFECEQNEIIQECLQSCQSMNTRFFAFKQSCIHRFYLQEEEEEPHREIPYSCVIKTIFLDKNNAREYIKYYGNIIQLGCEYEKILNEKINIFQQYFINEHPEYAHLLIPFYNSMNMGQYFLMFYRNTVVEYFNNYLENCVLDSQ